MEVRSLAEAEPFTTKDGSSIRLLIDLSNSSAQNQSLAEATLPPHGETTRHYHGDSEELYYVLAGAGEIELDGERAPLRPGDAVLIPPRAWHQIHAVGDGTLRFLCCCAPPYRDADTFFE